jgi:membrane protease subunit (stomatin/prohibitin family)
MGLGTFLGKQFIDVIQWTEDQDGVLAWRYPTAGHEIRYGAQLTVRETQTAIFVDEGQIADIFAPGFYTLTTETLPVLTYLKNWSKLFESPFKSDVYFFSTRIQTGRKWGTTQPVTVRDKDFGMVRLRAFGVYSYRIADAKTFFKEISATREIYTRDELEDQLRGILMAVMASVLGESQLPFLDMAANQLVLAEHLRGPFAEALQKYGLALDTLAIASITLPDELQQALDRRIAMGMTGDVEHFARYQAAAAIPLAAENPGGLAGIGAGLAAGAAIGQAMAPSPTAASASPSAASAEPAAATAEARLATLKSLLDRGLISAADYDSAKAELLKQIIG